jgi:hypothetical protein
MIERHAFARKRARLGGGGFWGTRGQALTRARRPLARAASQQHDAQDRIRRQIQPQYFDVVAFEEDEEKGSSIADATSSSSSATAARAPVLLRLGVVLSTVPEGDGSGNNNNNLTLAPLRKACDWAESGLWVEDEEEEEAGNGVGIQRKRERVVAIVTNASLSQRQDTENNPHGEHAHDVWELPLAGVEWASRESGGGRREEEEERMAAALAALLEGGRA